MAALRRIQKEYADIQKEGIEGIDVNPDESNLYHWVGVLTGPEPYYAGGKFKIDITFSLDYPFKAPVVKFLTRIYHPNITEDGGICIGLLKPDQWKPSTKIDQVLRALSQLLAEPNPEDALVASIAEVYSNDKAKFTKEAQAYVQKYAH
ncbi:ubiquitin-conjugating enzyme [Atractiella rhizophila]|nr:ubiquitin-conjugating enzyme [Atractiella rhizophila]